VKADRTARVNRLLQTTLAEIIPASVKDHRVRDIQVLSIVKVQTTPDLRFANVFLSILAEPEDQIAAIDGLNRARGFLRSELGSRLRLRRIPDLQFILDQTEEEAARIDQILKEIASEKDHE
jgi:ribosome-binding factor A